MGCRAAVHPPAAGPVRVQPHLAVTVVRQSRDSGCAHRPGLIELDTEVDTPREPVFDCGRPPVDAQSPGRGAQEHDLEADPGIEMTPRDAPREAGHTRSLGIAAAEGDYGCFSPHPRCSFV